MKRKAYQKVATFVLNVALVVAIIWVVRAFAPGLVHATVPVAFGVIVLFLALSSLFRGVTR